MVVVNQKPPYSEHVGRHAEWVSAHPDFGGSPRLRKLLRYLARRVEDDRAARVSQKDIATNVMGYDESFDPAVDAHVRIEVGRLRKALKLFYATCGDSARFHLVVPNGTYAPKLREAAVSGAAVHSQPEDSTPVVAIADFAATDVASEEVAALIKADALFRCQQSPIVGSGAIKIAIVSGGSEEDYLQAARKIGARVVVFGQVFHLDGAFRAYVATLDAVPERVVRRSCIRMPDGTPGQFADAVADEISTEVSDPMLGSTAASVARSANAGPLTALMGAYDFMSSQDLGRIEEASERLRRFTSHSGVGAAASGLLVDMTRVAQNAGLLGGGVSSARIVDLAEAAAARHVDNRVVQLATGYALLNDGEIGRANRIANEIASEPLPRSLALDAALLALLSAGDADRGDGRTNDQSADRFVMSELARVIRALKANDVAAAANILEDSTNEGVFWLHLFRRCVFGELGQIDKARRANERLASCVPNADRVLAAIVSGMFPDKEFRERLLADRAV